MVISKHCPSPLAFWDERRAACERWCGCCCECSFMFGMGPGEGASVRKSVSEDVDVGVGEGEGEKDLQDHVLLYRQGIVRGRHLQAV